MLDEKITLERLASDFRNAGIRKNDIIMLQSSMKSIGWVDGGADTVVEALLQVLGENGTLVVPTFTYSYSGRSEVVAFEKMTTPSSQTGIISETLRRRKDAQRSDHPSYSIAAVGKDAKLLTSNHPIMSPLGVGSPLYRLSEMGGRILLLGVGNDRNSVIHTAEAVAGVKYQCMPFKQSWGKAVKKLNSQGVEEIIEQKEFPGCSFNFGTIEDEPKLKGIIKFGKVGNAVTRLMDAHELISKVVEILKLKPDFLLCNRPDCECCTNRKKFIQSK